MKEYLVRVLVDKELLIRAYTGDDNSINPEDLVLKKCLTTN